MSDLSSLGIGPLSFPTLGGAGIEYLIANRPLQRVLAFTGHSIHDVINDPIARNKVIGYYKLHKQVERVCEAVDMERWWNGEDI